MSLLPCTSVGMLHRRSVCLDRSLRPRTTAALGAYLLHAVEWIVQLLQRLRLTVQCLYGRMHSTSIQMFYPRIEQHNRQRRIARQTAP